MDDIAREAGVSKMSVSLALRNDPSISKETREKVQEISNRLGYIPNRVAKGLVRGKSYTLGALVGGSLHDGYINQVLKSAINYALQRNYTLTTALTDGDTKTESNAINKFYEMMVDGYLIFHCNDVENYRFFNEHKIPHVMFTKYFDELDCDYVVCDDEKGAAMMTNHMIEMGHKRIAFVYDYLHNTSEVVNRMKGYKNALLDNGIAIDDSLIVPYYKNDLYDTNFLGDNTELVSCLQSDNPPTALFACNDTIASLLYVTLRQLGHNIPEDFSIGGYEGVYLGNLLNPPLTTVSTPVEEMGEIACKLLIDKIEGIVDFDTITKVKLTPKLTVRDSIMRR